MIWSFYFLATLTKKSSTKCFIGIEERIFFIKLKWFWLKKREYLSTNSIPQRHVMNEVVEDFNRQMFAIWVLYFARFTQLRFVVGRDCEAEELADGVVGAVDIVVLGGEGSEEEGGEGGGGDVQGGETEDLYNLLARIKLIILSKLECDMSPSFL